MTRTFAGQAWLQSPAAQAVLKALSVAGGEGRFVGGCVRNALMGREVDDIDVATTLVPQEVMAALTAQGIKAVPTGVDHGTVTAVLDGTPIEVTTLRRDVETDGRHAVVAFTTDWAEDAARRDFTVNALYADAVGQLYDPGGEGLSDLDAGRVRFIGDPTQRIREDYLRILRFFRIHAWYGTGALDAKGLTACGADAEGLAGISGERIQKEMLKLLRADAPVPALRAMAASGVVGQVLPGRLNVNRLERLCAIDAETFRSPEPVLRLAALLDGGDDQARLLADRWRLSNKDRDELCGLVGADDLKIVPYLSVREVRRLLYRIGVERFCGLCRLRWAEDPKVSNQMQWETLLALGRSWQRPTLPLTGNDVMRAGVPP
ncbi:MAG TPA: CCA tRNA nucleotidyltransferase, partial [Alphaproteobacteria bacterium]|nr:CCA tRNA nucleotidyltransferase [Alphaproteobacteria bacterium]